MYKLLHIVLILVGIISSNGLSTNKTNAVKYDGILPRYTADENDCEKYRLFVLREWLEYSCPTSMKWDRAISQCVGYNPAEDRCSSSYQKVEHTPQEMKDSSSIDVSKITEL